MEYAPLMRAAIPGDRVPFSVGIDIETVTVMARNAQMVPSPSEIPVGTSTGQKQP
jgi:hypothetical protein